MDTDVKTGKTGTEESRNNRPAATVITQGLPLFYEHVELLSPSIHNSLSVKETDYTGFAAETDHVPLLVNEFVEAQRHYPIVFSGGTNGGSAFALVGELKGSNVFVEGGGKWASGCYVPAHVRRYPFLGIHVVDTGELTFGVDTASPLVEEADFRPLYTDAEPTPVLKEAIDLCRRYAISESYSLAFCTALHEHDLLAEGQAMLEFPTGETKSYGGFYVINREKFDALPDAVIAEWRQKHWLEAIYAHFASFSAWDNIRDRILHK